MLLAIVRRFAVVFFLSAVSFALNPDALVKKFKNSPCLKVDFFQRNTFHGKVRSYEGLLVKRGKTLRVVYFTSPPFEVSYDGEFVRVGYAGEKGRTYRADRYPNPLVRVLTNLDRWDELFEVKSCGESSCVLIPKKSLRGVKRLVVFGKNGALEGFEVWGDRRGKNRVFIRVRRMVEGCSDGG
jgi:hypothetical protein